MINFTTSKENNVVTKVKLFVSENLPWMINIQI